MKNIVAVIFMVVFLVELYFCSAGSAHRKKKKLKGWNPVTGKIKSIEKVTDALTRRNVMELTIRTDGGSTVDPITAKYESSLTSPANPTKGGYIFNGWSPAFPSTMPKAILFITVWLTLPCNGLLSSLSQAVAMASFLWCSTIPQASPKGILIDKVIENNKQIRESLSR